MDLNNIIAFSGKPGLFKVLIQTRSGFLIESLLDGKKLNVTKQSPVSALKEISMYSYDEDVPVEDIMRTIAIKENEGPTSVTSKDDNSKIAAYFKEILPDYDEDRVYVSDIKKLLNWYNLLQSKGMVSKEAPIVENAEAIKEQVVEEVKAEEKKSKAKK